MPRLIPNPARVLVTGGRTYNDRQVVEAALRVYTTAVLCHGGARGADSLAGEVARGLGIPVQVMHADWATYGKHAGPIRNREMLEKFRPDILIAFPGGAGTMHMRRIAEAAGVPIYVVSGK